MSTAAEHGSGAGPGDRTALIASSFCMLFTELALIRWAASHVVYLAYFTNFVLLASFLGIGLGFLRPSRRAPAFAPLAVAAVCGFVVVFPVQVAQTEQIRGLAGLFGMFALPMWITLPVIFLGVVVALGCIAARVGALLSAFPPLEAYRLDILGSIAGTVAFSVLAFFQLRPAVWGLVICVGLWLSGPAARQRIGRMGMLAILAVFLAGSLDRADSWSPYYRVTASDTSKDGSVAVKVNGIPHQSIVPLDRLTDDQPFYLFPYQHLPGAPGDVLIVGAGTGNDVQVALAQGAGHVDAVEIDPVLQRIGEEQHPDRPYDDPRVSEHVDDGRAFLENTDRTYDLILFALPDSLTLVSGQSSLRLESYLFTVESFEAVREHLDPGGVFSIYNYYFPIVFARLSGTMQSVFGQEPCFDRGESSIGNVRQQSVLTIGRTPDAVECDLRWHPSSEFGTPPAATDDYPFPYLRGRTVPSLYLATLALILMATVVSTRVIGGVRLRSTARYLDLFFLGAAFLLLETKNVVQFALLFGTTWFVNALVILGVLLAVLLAVEVGRRVRLPPLGWLYGLLFASLAVAWLVRPESLLSLGAVPRFFAAAALAFAPVFTANLVFAERFRETASASTALGVNLLGAMLGGALEYAALLVGYRALLLLAAVTYGAALLTSRLGRRAALDGAKVGAPSLPDPQGTRTTRWRR